MAFRRTRVIPALLLKNDGLVKTDRFRKSRYIGDPINTVRILNEKEVDEIAFLDITASSERRGPNLGILEWIAGEAFMPMSYGGGITTLDEVRRILELGFEKVIINSASYSDLDLLREASRAFGAQAVVGSVDVSRSLFGKYRLVSHGGRKKQSVDLQTHLANLASADVGEVFLTSVDREGTMKGYDLDLIRMANSEIDVPVVAHGGAGSLEDLRAAVEEGGASAVSAGSIFVYQGARRAVLINYPDNEKLKALLP